jgi:hypothetical protein
MSYIDQVLSEVLVNHPDLSATTARECAAQLIAIVQLDHDDTSPHARALQRDLFAAAMELITVQQNPS